MNRLWALLTMWTVLLNIVEGCQGHGGATTTGPDATHPPTIFENLGGGGGSQPGVGGGGVPPGGRGGVWQGVGGGVWPGVMGASSQG